MKKLKSWIKIRPYNSPTVQFNTNGLTQHLTTFPSLGSESQHFSALGVDKSGELPILCSPV